MHDLIIIIFLETDHKSDDADDDYEPLPLVGAVAVDEAENASAGEEEMVVAAAVEEENVAAMEVEIGGAVEEEIVGAVEGF